MAAGGGWGWGSGVGGVRGGGGGHVGQWRRPTLGHSHERKPLRGGEKGQ